MSKALAPKKEEKTHSKYSASASDRWLSCPGSIYLCSTVPPQPESRYAEEGTRAHECVEEFLNNIGQFAPTMTRLNKTYPREMVWHALQAAQEIVLMKPEGAELLSETRSELYHINPEMYGTADAIILDFFGTLKVIDFKYGAGISVSPKDNTQLIYYALGVAHKYDYNFESVELTIIQPRDGSKNTTRTHTISIEELMSWNAKFKLGVERCEDDIPEFLSGDHCRWCAAKTVCFEFKNAKLREVQKEFANEDEPKNMKKRKK